MNYNDNNYNIFSILMYNDKKVNIFDMINYKVKNESDIVRF